MDTSKIIKGVVNSGRYTVTAPIVKEDYGLYLKIEGLELPSTYEVDFSNSENSGSSVTMIGNSDGVKIPTQFIKSGKDVFAFLYHVGADYGRTVYKFRIPNKLRPDRTNEEPTPEEQSTIDQAISALNSAVAATAQDVIDAAASASAASQSESNAHDSELAAQGYASDASGYASDAQGYATTASQKATAAGNSATAASQSEEAARGYAQTASEKADAITGLTATATTLEAGSSATASYSNGTLTLGIPRGADGDDGYSPTASVTKSGKTATISITDKNGTTSAQVTDGEDGTTGATPNLTIGTVETLEPTESATASITGTPENPILNLGIPQGEQGEVTLADLNTALMDKADIITDTASGSIASFSDGADDLPLKSLVIDINPIQDLSNGDPSPENICPISGWTQVDVNHSDADMTNPTTITIDLGQTVYGGKLDVLSGVLTAYRISETKKWGDLGTVTDLGTNERRKFSLANVPKFTLQSASDDLKCNMVGVYSTTYSLDEIHMYIASNGYAWIYLPDTTDSNADIQLSYSVATPITIQLTPHEVSSLLGVNNIWADSGDTEVVYRADTKLYIERLTEPDADMIADSNIVSGQYFMVGNSLYKATANIASGSAVIVGTNATRKSLAQALNEINA